MSLLHFLSKERHWLLQQGETRFILLCIFKAKFQSVWRTCCNKGGAEPNGGTVHAADAVLHREHNKELENYSHIKIVVYSSRCPKKNRMLLDVNNSNQNWVGPNFPIDMTWECLVKTTKKNFLMTLQNLVDIFSSNECQLMHCCSSSILLFIFSGTLLSAHFRNTMYYTIRVCRLFFK